MSAVKRLQRRVSQIQMSLSPKKHNFAHFLQNPQNCENELLTRDDSHKKLFDSEKTILAEKQQNHSSGASGSDGEDRFLQITTLGTEEEELFKENTEERAEEMVYCAYLSDLAKSGKATMKRIRRRNHSIGELVAHCSKKFGLSEGSYCDTVGAIVGTYKGELEQKKSLEKHITEVQKLCKATEQLIADLSLRNRIAVDRSRLHQLERNIRRIPRLEAQLAKKERQKCALLAPLESKEASKSISSSRGAVHALLNKLYPPHLHRLRTLLVLQPSQTPNTEKSRRGENCSKLWSYGKQKRNASVVSGTATGNSSFPMVSVETGPYLGEKTPIFGQTSTTPSRSYKSHTKRPITAV